MRPGVESGPISGRAAGARASGFVVLALIGAWAGHTLEYLRVNGPARLGGEMTGSVHLYMLPLGGALMGLAAVGGIGWWRRMAWLACRLERLRVALRRGLGPGEMGRWADAPVPGRAARSGSLCLLLGGAQVVLYVVQENVESRVAGLRAPGLGAVLGRHWAAVPTHLLVAAVLALTASGLVRQRRRLEEEVAKHERIHARLWARRVASGAVPSRGGHFLTPHERWSSQRWQRPPPASIAA